MTANLPSVLDQNQPPHPLLASLLVVGCLCFSTVFACATPFAALATLAALNCGRRDALLLVTAAWLANQAVGFGLLHYPGTWDTVAWGFVIGAGACAGVLAARAVPALRSLGIRHAAAFLAAFTVYEAVLYASSFVLPNGGAGFTARVVAYVFAVNAIGIVVLSAASLALTGFTSRIARPARPAM